ncbi:MAG: cadmium-translocating P-type ATPase [Clostridia bacterium]|nr:cadmium-translocating P-type ATPase [Clostridia bacterium]
MSHTHTHEHEHSCACQSHSCGCHSHEHNDKRKIPLSVRLVIGLFFAISGFLLPKAELYLFALSYLVLGYDVLIAAAKNIIKLRPLDENFLMTAAAVGAFILGEHFEAAAVMFFYQVGEYLTDNAVEKTKSSISALLDVRPDTARILTSEGEQKIPCEAVRIGQTVLVGAGERIAVDGTITKGSAMLDTSSLTGEPLPRSASVGDSVLAGMISTDGSLEIRAKKEFSDSTLSRILTLAQTEHSKKSGAERFITSFAKVYTPIVVLLAALVAVIPPLLGFGAFSVWVFRALSFLVISCPCALVVSIPLTFFAAMGCASKNGVLVKNSVTIENLSKIKTAAFDKTGTLTEGVPTLTEIRVNGSKAELLELAAYAECDSTHPLAAAIKNAYANPIDRSRITSVTEIPARGIRAEIVSDVVLIGSKRLLLENNIDVPDLSFGNAVFVAKNSAYMGYIGFGDRIKSDSKRAVSNLSKMGINSVLLSGDSENSVSAVADAVGISEYFSELLPIEKAEHIKRLSENGAVLFVGDGINDSPSIASAAVGAAMGGAGSDAAIESADMVIMGDEPSRAAGIIKLASAAMRIVRQNIVLALGIKFGIMIISAFGIGGMLPAIFADVGVCVITVANSLRAYYMKPFAHLADKHTNLSKY